MKNQFPIEEYFNRLLIFANAALNPDGTELAYISSVTGSPQIWWGKISDEKNLISYPKPVTSGKSAQPYIFEKTMSWVDCDQLACVFDTDGDEQAYIEILNVKSGETLAIPRGQGSRDFLGFVTAEKIYFTSNRDNLNSQGLFCFDIKMGEVKKLFQDPNCNSVWAGNLLYKGCVLFNRNPSVSTLHLCSLNLKTKKVENLFAEKNVIMVPFAVTKKGILVISNYQNEFHQVGLFDPHTKEIKYVGKFKWDLQGYLSPNQKHLFIEENSGGRSVLNLLTWPTQKKRPLKFFDKGVIEHVSFSKDSRYALVSYVSTTQTRNFYRINLKNLEIQQLTDTYSSKVPQSTLVAPMFVKYPSQDREIHAMLFLPHKSKKNNSLPVIVWPHGGPQWQERPSQRPIFQYFLSRGFAIWAPNPTGSTGYGKSFTKAIERAWGTADLPDMANGIEWLKNSGWINANKMAIMGGSYGGYMTLRSITQFPDAFKVAVDIFGVSNLLTFSVKVPEDWRPYMDELVGNPEKDKKMLMEQSPVFALDKVKCPLLVIQGAKDPRVVQSESDQVVDSMKKRGQIVEYLVFEDEGHGFFKLENELRAYKQAADFIAKTLQV